MMASTIHQNPNTNRMTSTRRNSFISTLNPNAHEYYPQQHFFINNSYSINYPSRMTIIRNPGFDSDDLSTLYYRRNPGFSSDNNYNNNISVNYCQPSSTTHHHVPVPVPVPSVPQPRRLLEASRSIPTRANLTPSTAASSTVTASSNSNFCQLNGCQGQKGYFRVGGGTGGGGEGGEKGVSVIKPGGKETTAMIRNIPNQYTRKMLVEFLDDFCKKENQRLEDISAKNPRSTSNPPPIAYDFLYLPMDFRRGANKGYAFVNFTHPTGVWKLHLATYNQGWEHCRSPKKCQISYAAIQGKDELIDHLENTKFECDKEEYLPVCFSPARDGSDTNNVAVTQTTIGQPTLLPRSLPTLT